MPRRARTSPLKRFFSLLGPGVTTGAADDDPSGIATYSIAGAQLGTSLLWTALITWPLMAFIQLMCARIGMVTGRGLAGALRQSVHDGCYLLARPHCLSRTLLPSAQISLVCPTLRKCLPGSIRRLLQSSLE